MMILKTIKQSMFWTLGAAGNAFRASAILGRWTVDRESKKLTRRESPPLLILNYHRVLPAYNPFAIDAISTQDFEAQVKILKNNFEILPLAEAAENLKTGNLTSPTVCLTFDDGYRDNYDHAYPVLAKHNVPATIFLTTDFINTSNMLWHDRVLALFEKTKVSSLRVPELDAFEVTFDNQKKRRSAAFYVLEKLKKFAPQERDAIINSLASHLDVKALDSDRLMLTWDEISIMVANGISFGAHTLSHPILSTLDDASLQQEIAGSKKIIEQHLNIPVTTFAYPNGRPGDYDERAVSMLQNAGFHCAVTTVNGLNGQDHNPFELSRLAPWETNAYRFYGRLLVRSFSN